MDGERRPGLFRRVARRVRQLFSSGPPTAGFEDDDLEGGLGVREPRRPERPTRGGAVALELPPEEKRDVRAIGEDRD